MKVLPVRTEIDEVRNAESKDKQVQVLFEGPRRKIIQITLRNRAVLTAHKASEPITVQCVAGRGVFHCEGEALKLVPGILLTLEPNVLHEVAAEPDLSILVTRFL